MRAIFGVAVVLLSVSCSVKADPDKGRYACSAPADCGFGYDCRAQATGGSLCFKSGTCAASEMCNGSDDDCNGLIDESFPEETTECTTTVPGLCSKGVDVCEAGTIVCKQTALPATELCNGLDDNCDGRTDENFDRTSDSLNCGVCGRACTTGTTCRDSECHETTCNDQLDNDLDHKFDCDDEDCLTLQCSVSQVPAWSCAYVLQTDGGVDAGLADAGVMDAGLLDAGDLDAGNLMGAPPAPDPLPPLDAGVYTLGCYPPESACGNGFDDDGDGLVDCADVDCTGAVCDAGKICRSLQCVTP